METEWNTKHKETFWHGGNVPNLFFFILTVTFTFITGKRYIKISQRCTGHSVGDVQRVPTWKLPLFSGCITALTRMRSHTHRASPTVFHGIIHSGSSPALWCSESLLRLCHISMIDWIVIELNLWPPPPIMRLVLQWGQPSQKIHLEWLALPESPH